MSGSQLIFTGDSRDGIDQDGDEYTEFDYEYAPLGAVSSSAPSMGTYPLVSQLSSGGTISQSQYDLIVSGAYDSEMQGGYGYSDMQIYSAKRGLESMVMSGKVRIT